MAKQPTAIGIIPIRGVFHHWVPQQDGVWVDNDGYVYRVADIDCEYAVNIIRFLWRRRSTIVLDGSEDGFRNLPIVKALIKDIYARQCIQAAALDVELILALTDGVPT